MIFRLHLLCLSLVLGACATASAVSDAGPDNENRSDAAPDLADADIPADADTCPGDPCQIAPQCGCTGQACDLDGADLANGGTSCRNVTVPGTELSSCASSTSCASGFVCLGGQCRAYCNGETPCDNGQCLVQPVFDSGGGVFVDIPGVSACSKNCSPEQSTNNGCPSSPQFGCHLVRHNPDGIADNGDEFFYSDCRTTPATGGGNGAACPGGNPDCQAGFECVVISAMQVCKQLCIVPGGTCAQGTCSALIDPAVISGVEYGVCL